MRAQRVIDDAASLSSSDSFLMVVDAPVIMPQIQFIHRRLFFQLRRRDRYPQCIRSCSLCSSWTRFLTCPLRYFERCFVRWCRKLWLSRSCRPSKVVDIPFVPQRQILMVHTILQTTQFPQLLYVSGGQCPCCAVVDNNSLRPRLVMLVTIRLGCIPLGCRRPRSSASWPVWTRRTVAVAFTRLVLLVTTDLALCSLPWLARPRCLAAWPVWPQRQLRAFSLQ